MYWRPLEGLSILKGPLFRHVPLKWCKVLIAFQMEGKVVVVCNSTAVKKSMCEGRKKIDAYFRDVIHYRSNFCCKICENYISYISDQEASTFFGS